MLLSAIFYIPLFLLNGIWTSSTSLEILAVPFLLSYTLLFFRFNIIGLPVGKLGQGWGGFPDPNLFGWIVIVGVQLLILYILALLFSIIWYKIKRKKIVGFDS